MKNKIKIAIPIKMCVVVLYFNLKISRNPIPLYLKAKTFDPFKTIFKLTCL
jgi:hypothetical protein